MLTAWCDPLHRGSCTGNNKRASTLRQKRTCTTMQNTLPKAVRSNLRSACNWMQRGRQRWSRKTAVVKTHGCGWHSLKRRPMQVAYRNFLSNTVRRWSLASWCVAQSSGATLSPRGIHHVCACATANWRWSHFSLCARSGRWDGRRDNIDGTMAPGKPLRLSLRVDNEAAAVGPLLPLGSPLGSHSGVTPKVGHGMLARRLTSEKFCAHRRRIRPWT